MFASLPPPWLAAAICRGAYPWEASAPSAEPAAAAGVAAATREQLVTRLRTHANEVQRAQEELDLLTEERQRCLGYLQLRQAQTSAALVQCQERSAALRDGSPVPACGSFGAGQPASQAARSQELQYCEGLALLLSRALQKATVQLATARSAFGGGSGTGGESTEAVADEYECVNEEDEVI